jgi:hypothetical protein
MTAGIIARLFGARLPVVRARLHFLRLPILGIAFGLTLGGDGIEAMFRAASPLRVTSWFARVVVAPLFAVLPYRIYLAAVAIIGGSGSYPQAVGVARHDRIDSGFQSGKWAHAAFASGMADVKTSARAEPSSRAAPVSAHWPDHMGSPGGSS